MELRKRCGGIDVEYTRVIVALPFSMGFSNIIVDLVAPKTVRLVD